MTDGWERVRRNPQQLAYAALEDDITTPESLLTRNRAVTYETAQRAAQEIFVPSNLIVSLYDVPHDEALMNTLDKKTKSMRHRLGE